MDKQKKFRVLPNKTENEGIVVFELLEEPYSGAYVQIGRVQLREEDGNLLMNLDYEVVHGSDTVIEEIKKSDTFTDYIGECVTEYLEDMMESDPKSLTFSTQEHED